MIHRELGAGLCGRTLSFDQAMKIFATWTPEATLAQPKGSSYNFT